MTTTSTYNSSSNNLTSVGYMYGEQFKENYSWDDDKQISIYDTIYYDEMVDTEDNYFYYIGDSVSYVDGIYTIQNSEERSIFNEYLIGYYACPDGSTSCSTVYYIVNINSESYEECDCYEVCDEECYEECDNCYEYSTFDVYFLPLSNGETINSSTITLSETIVDNGDYTYTLSNSVQIKKTDWYTEHSNYEGYYFCEDLSSTTCNQKNIIVGTYVDTIHYNALTLYGNDVIYNGTNYTLVDTYASENYENDYKTLATKYHYTCFNASGTCTTVYYITEFDSSGNYYYTLTNGKNIEDIKSQSLTNTYESIIKKSIDNWYEQYMTEYTDKLENTIWCNDRTIATSSLNKDESALRRETYFSTYSRRQASLYIPIVNCQNKNDSFTLSVASGGTEGYGNNMLKYPVGLLTADEVAMAGSGTSTYLYTGQTWWTMSPNYSNYVYSYSNQLNSQSIYSNLGTRPSVSLIPGTKIIDGDGTADNPYIIQ